MGKQKKQKPCMCHTCPDCGGRLPDPPPLRPFVVYPWQVYPTITQPYVAPVRPWYQQPMVTWSSGTGSLSQSTPGLIATN